VSGAPSLPSILGRVRRRLRVLAAVQGAVAAAGLALIAMACLFAALRLRGGSIGGPALRGSVAMLLALCGAGAGLAALRRIPLERCARIIDQALGGGDRALSALSFQAVAAPTPFMAAAVADAIRRSALVAPAALAPFRRPAGAFALEAGVLLVALAGLIPLPARGSRTPPRPVTSPSPPSPDAARVRLDPSALEPERDEAAQAQRAAAALEDQRLAELARELGATVDELGLGRGEALDRLADLQRRSEAAAVEAERLQRSLESAGKTLQAATATRAAGKALRAQDPAATEKTMSELAAQAAGASARARNAIAGALDRAGEQALFAGASPTESESAAARSETARATAGGKTASQNQDQATRQAMAQEDSDRSSDQSQPQRQGERPEPDQQRRLAREHQPAPPISPAAGAAGSNGPRRLQRLDENLKDAAAACRADSEACRRQLDQQAHELPRMEQQARSAEARRRLSQAVRQLRERLRRGDAGEKDGARRSAERRFMRAARGEGADGKETETEGDPGGADPASEDAEVSEQQDLGGASPARAEEEGTPPGSGGGASAQSGPPAAASGPGGDQSKGAPGDGQGDPGRSPGEGIGNQAGGDPLGQRGALGARGRAREARLGGAAGPSRSEIIQAAARRGFAHTPYRDVFAAYRAAVEESLDGGDVPPGERYIVRRYFQLIRPAHPSPSSAPR
jgi:hypothetical protein